MKHIRDAQTIIGALEDGDVAAELSQAIQDTLSQLHAQCEGRAKAKVKGKVTLTLDFTVEGAAVNITPEITAKVPKPPRNSSFYFLLEDGTLSTEHPQQMNMFTGPREARADERTSA